MSKDDFDYTHAYRVITDNHTKSTDFVPPDYFEKPFYYQKAKEEIRKNESKSGGATSSQNGCYVATCVYGSYDCPEVWVLRRFRDGVMAKTIFGRAFIKVYYAVSPKAVKLFGKNKLFRSFCKQILDKSVCRLRDKGFENTPYKD